MFRQFMIELDRQQNPKRCFELVAAGMNVNERTANGMTALMKAACFNHLEVCQMLIDNGADVNAVWEDRLVEVSNTALRMARRRGKQAAIDLLLRNGAIDLAPDDAEVFRPLTVKS